MLGYLNQPEMTSETIIYGWLRTNDIGFFDGDGYLFLESASAAPWRSHATAS